MITICLYDNGVEGEPLLIKAVAYYNIKWSDPGDDSGVKELGKKLEALMDDHINS